MKRIVFVSLVFIIMTLSYAGMADKVSLPVSLIVIEEAAFYGDTGLDVVDVKGNCIEIGKEAFANSSIKEIYIPDSVTSIADDAFDNTSELTIYSSSTAYAKTYASRKNINWCDVSESGEKVVRLDVYPENRIAAEGSTIFLDAVFLEPASNSDVFQESDAVIDWQRSLDNKQWESTGFTDRTLVLDASAENCRYYYRCHVSIEHEVRISSSVKMAVDLKVGITAKKNGTKEVLTASARYAERYSWQVSSDGDTWADCQNTGNSLSFDYVPEEFEKQYRCQVTDSYGNVGTSDPFQPVYAIQKPVLSKKQTIRWAETRFSRDGVILEFNHVFADDYVLKWADNDSFNNAKVFDTRKNYFSEDDWESDVSAYYITKDGEELYHQNKFAGGWDAPYIVLDNNVASLEFTVRNLRLNRTYYFTVEAIKDDETVQSDVLSYTSRAIDSTLPSVEIKSVSVEDGHTVIKYGLNGDKNKISRISIYRSSVDNTDGAFIIANQLTTDSSFGTWRDHNSGNSFWLGLAAFDENNHCSDLAFASPYEVSATIKTSANPATHNTEVTLTVSGESGITSYSWESSEDGESFYTLTYSDKYTGAKSTALKFISTRQTCVYYRCHVENQYGYDGYSNIIKVDYKPDWEHSVPKLVVEQKGSFASLSWEDEEAAPAYAVYEVVNGKEQLIKKTSLKSAYFSYSSFGNHTYYVKGCSDTSDSSTYAFTQSDNITANFLQVVLDKSTISLSEATNPNTKVAVTSPAGSVEWTSNDQSVATVDKNGNITAVSGGTTDIIATVKIENGYAEGKCEVTVNPRKYRGVFIGNKYYPGDTRPAMRNDVYSMKEALETADFLGSGTYNIKCMVDTTKSSVKSAIASQFLLADENDISLFYFCGHGVPYRSGQYAGALCLSNGEYIFGTDLAGWLSSIKGTKVVFIASCGSGALIGRGSNQDEYDLDYINESIISAFKNADENQLMPRNGELAQNGFYVITAAATGDYGWANGSSSWLNYYMLEGLGFWQCAERAYEENSIPADYIKDNKVSFLELAVYTKDRMDNHLIQHEGKLYKQTMRSYSSGGDIIIYRR